MSSPPAPSIPNEKLNSWSYTSPEVVSQRLDHMVGASADICDHSVGLFEIMRGARHASNRAHAIRWIKEVAALSNMSMDARDTSVQIFDRYFGRHLLVEPAAFDDPQMFSTVAAVSVLLSSKFHESRPLSMSSFSTFTPDVLSEAENRVLMTLDYNIVPLATPTSFIHHMLLLWPSLENNVQFLATVTDISCKVVGEFWESAASCRYAPSTIALAALMLAFSSLHVDCSRWLLDCVPDACLPGERNAIFPRDEMQLLDIDSCLVDLQSMCCSRKVGGSPRAVKEAADLCRDDSCSPVGIADRAETPVAEAAALSLSDDGPVLVGSPRAFCSSKNVAVKSKRIKLF